MKIFFCVIISSFILILLYVYILQNRKKPIEGFNDWLYSMDKATTIPDSYIKTQVVAKEGNESKIHDTNSIIADLNDNIAIENNLFNIATITHGSNVTSIHDLGSTIDNLENLISTFDNEILDANMDVNTITISELDQRITKLKDLHQTLIDSLNVQLKNSIPDGWHQNLPIMQSKIERLTDIILYYENVKKTLVNDNTFLPVVPNISFEFENNWQRMNDMCKSEVGECWLRDSDNEKIYSKMSFDHIHTKPEDWPNNLSTCERNVKEMNGNQDTCIDTKNTASFLNTACDHIDSISLYEVGNTAEYTKIPNSLFNASKSGSGMNEKINCSVNHSGTLNETYFTDINVVKEKATNNCHNNGHHGEERFSCWGMDNGIDINNQSIVSAGAQIKNLNTFSKSWSDTTSSSNKHGSCLINDSCRSESELREHVNHIKEPNNWQCRTVSQSADGLTVSNNQVNTYKKVYIPGTWNSTTNTRNTRTITYADDSCRSLADANAHTNCLSSGNYKCYEIDGQNNVVEKGLTVKKVYTQPTNVTDPNTIGTCNTTNPCLTFEQAQNNAQTNAQTLCTSQTIKCYNADNTTTDQNMVYANGQCSKPSTCQEERSCIYQTVYTDNSQTFNSGDIGKTNCTSSTGTQHAWLLESVHSDSANNRNDYSKWSSDLSGANNFCSRNQTEINAFNTTNKTKNSTTPCIFSCTASDYDTNISSFENEANAIAGINVNNDICSSSALCDVTYWKAKLKNTNCVGDPTSDIQQANVNCPENCVPVVTAPVVTAPVVTAPTPAPDPVPVPVPVPTPAPAILKPLINPSIIYELSAERWDVPSLKHAIPDFKPNYPFISRITDTSVEIVCEFNEYVRRMRWVILPYYYPKLTRIEVERLGNNRRGGHTAYGTHRILMSQTNDVLTITAKLRPSIEYRFVCIVSDDYSRSNSFNIITFTTDADPVPNIVEPIVGQETTSIAIPTANYKDWAVKWKPGAEKMINLITTHDQSRFFPFFYRLVNFYDYVDFNGLSEIRNNGKYGLQFLGFNGSYSCYIRFTFIDLDHNVDTVDEYELFHGNNQWKYISPINEKDLYSFHPRKPRFSGRRRYDVYVQLITKCGDCQKIPHIIGTGITEPLKFRMEPLQHQMQFNLWPNMRIPEYNIEPIHFYKPGYPFISRISSTSVDIKFKFLEYTGLVRWMIVPYGHTSLQNYEIETLPLNAPNRISNGNLTIRNANEYTITSNSLIANSGYRFHFVLVGETDLKLDNKNYIQFNTNLVIDQKLLMHQHWYNEIFWF